MPSRRKMRAKSCETKRRYPTASEAEATAQHRREESGELLDIYPCRFCNGWHIGHAAPKQKPL